MLIWRQIQCFAVQILYSFLLSNHTILPFSLLVEKGDSSVCGYWNESLGWRALFWEAAGNRSLQSSAWSTPLLETAATSCVVARATPPTPLPDASPGPPLPESGRPTHREGETVREWEWAREGKKKVAYVYGCSNTLTPQPATYPPTTCIKPRFLSDYPHIPTKWHAPKQIIIHLHKQAYE